jgi:adenosylhomocysteine nucleosidase
MTCHRINIAVALPAEAKPLIHAFGLRRRQPDTASPLYVGGDLALVLTGTGAAAMQRGVIHLSQYACGVSARWLNVGIAGHGSLAVGSCLLADSVNDRQTGRRWRLHAPRGLGIPAGPLHCVDKAESDYAANTGYDMESGGFAAALSTIDALDRTCILKIVSDGPDQPSERITGKMVSNLVLRTIPLITALITRLHDHA